MWINIGKFSQHKEILHFLDEEFEDKYLAVFLWKPQMNSNFTPFHCTQPLHTHVVLLCCVWNDEKRRLDLHKAKILRKLVQSWSFFFMPLISLNDELKTILVCLFDKFCARKSNNCSSLGWTVHIYESWWPHQLIIIIVIHLLSTTRCHVDMLRFPHTRH